MIFSSNLPPRHNSPVPGYIGPVFVNLNLSRRARTSWTRKAQPKIRLACALSAKYDRTDIVYLGRELHWRLNGNLCFESTLRGL